MKSSPKKVKLILFAAIALAVVLFICSIALIITINIKQQEIARQKAEITQLENKLKNHKEDNPDVDNEIVITEDK